MFISSYWHCQEKSTAEQNHRIMIKDAGQQKVGKRGQKSKIVSSERNTRRRELLSAPKLAPFLAGLALEYSPIGKCFCSDDA
jgi:hypothetical protein